MGKISMNLMFCCLVFAIWAACANAQEPVKDESLLQNFCKGNEKVAGFRVYVQDVLVGPNATVWEVARANITSNSDTNFGLVRVLDNLLTAEPDPKSAKVGRLQGIVAFTDLQELAVTMNFNFYFTEGRFRGSTLCVVGRQQLLDDRREVSVVGGTGLFRMTRGYAISTTHTDARGGYGVLIYDFYVAYLGEEPRLELLVSGD